MAVVGGRAAWRTPEEVAGALGQGIEETMDVLADLDLAGWVAVWDRDDGPVVTLTPWAAERLGLRLAEFGPDEVPRWIGAGDPGPPLPRSHPARYATFISLEGGFDAEEMEIIDPAPGPADAIEQGEGVGARIVGASQIDALIDRGHIFPTRLLGLNLTPWPGWSQASAAACPVCGGGDLSPHTYCLYCDHWGLDCLVAIGPQRRSPRPSRSPRVSPHASPTSWQERLRADRLHRKARRAARRAARYGGEEPRRQEKGQPSPPGASLLASYGPPRSSDASAPQPQPHEDGPAGPLAQGRGRTRRERGHPSPPASSKG
ncbi:MAG: hypothetical protein IRY99_20420 [Isosphaeraceae bacterium]|nr:hypothetical protein [Isosphaeraceae bacterium]